MSLIKAEKTEKNLYVLEFSVDKAKFEEAINNAYRKQVKKVNIPGFRPGKAPRHIIEKMYGKGFFYDDAFNEVLPEAYESALKESGIDSVSRPDIDVKSVDEGVVFTANVYVRPEVSIEGYRGIEVEKHVHTVTDEEIDAEINNLRERNAREIDVTDRAAELGDIAEIDYEGFESGVAFEGGHGENHQLELGSGSFIPGFEEQIVGHNVGDSFDVEVTFPEQYHSEELAGKLAVFKCRLNSIKKKELPELDDEFAKDISEFNTFLEYRDDVKAKIQKRHEDTADMEFNSAITEALAGKIVAEIPEAMYETETENFVRDYDNRLRMQGLNLSEYFKYTGQTLDDMRKQMRPQAEIQVKTRLALEKIVELENIKISEDEVNTEYERLVKEYNMEIDRIKEVADADGISKDLAVQKALELVRESAVVKMAECHCDDDDAASEAEIVAEAADKADKAE